mmetsp:Transcript_615/g.1449  ORF Transcript_615/g.1449 Transcript_615/m.1449 type:complete len:329 (+) Transcript_615:29-1015(+)
MWLRRARGDPSPIPDGLDRTEYCITLLREQGQPLWDISTSSQGLFVVGLTGAAAEWNRNNPQFPVSLDDQIIRVNCFQDVPRMLRALDTARCLRIVLRRPSFVPSISMSALRRYDVTITREPGIAWGVSFKMDYERGFLVVWSIGDGMLSEWNRHNPHSPFSGGDVVIKVNESYGSPDELLRKLKEAVGVVSVTVCRPCWSSSDTTLFLQKVVARLPRVSPEEAGVSQCGVCLDDIPPDGQLLRLPCRHSFCEHCVECWLTMHRATCPLCIAPLVVEEPTFEGDSAPLCVEGSASEIPVTAVTVTRSGGLGARGVKCVRRASKPGVCT